MIFHIFKHAPEDEMHILRWLVLYVVIVKLTDVFDFE